MNFGSSRVIHHTSIVILPDTSYAIVGPSGSGKSTLLGLLSLFLQPSSGVVLIDGQPAWSRSRRGGDLRRGFVGWIGQLPLMLPNRTAEENVSVACEMIGVPAEKARSRALAALGDLGLSSRTGIRASDLSGGEQQRVAVARAIAMRMPLLLADEPTASLDRSNSALVGTSLVDHRSRGTSVVIATHDLAIAGLCDHVLRLEDGVLVPR